MYIPHGWPPRPSPGSAGSPWAALANYLSKRYLSNKASSVSCAVYSIKDHHDLPIHSPRLEKTCVRQVLFTGWSNNHFNNLRFNNSLETKDNP